MHEEKDRIAEGLLYLDCDDEYFSAMLVGKWRKHQTRGNIAKEEARAEEANLETRGAKEPQTYNPIFEAVLVQPVDKVLYRLVPLSSANVISIAVVKVWIFSKDRFSLEGFTSLALGHIKKAFSKGLLSNSH